MPERNPDNWEFFARWAESLAQSALLAGVGVFIGLGQLLNSTETLTPRLIAGRALCTGGLGMAAAVALVWLPDIPIVVQVGMAATTASLGTSALERAFQRITGGGS